MPKFKAVETAIITALIHRLMSGILTKHNFDAFLKSEDRDLLQELLKDKRSPNTRRAYEQDLKDFFKTIAGQEPSQQLVSEFLQLERTRAISLVLKYKAGLIERGLAEATVNRRLSALRSLVSFAQRVGKCLWSLEEVEGEKIRAYRDTSGVDAETYRRVLDTCDRSSLKGTRDYAILRLLWDNVPRRDEVSKTNVNDFDSGARTLKILGKGRGTQKEAIALSAPTAEAIWSWLKSRSAYAAKDPLFTTLDRASWGSRLSGNAIYELVRGAAEAAHVGKILSPHRVRHSGITAALELSGGDVRRVKKLSRHAKAETVLIYDDNRVNHQKTLTDKLSDAIAAGEAEIQ